MFISHYDSPLGGITIACDVTALLGLWFDGQKHFGAGLDLSRGDCVDNAVSDAVRRWLDTYFSGRVPDFTPPLRLTGTPFRRAVWQQLLTIPYGATTTYGDIARRVAHEMSIPTMSAQAVGNAVGHNPVSLIVPCHRVIAADGSLTGYAAGLDRKYWLLQMEERKQQ